MDHSSIFPREIQPVFSKWVDVPEIEKIEKARLYVCGLGLYEVYINGKKVGDQFLTPYFTDYRYWIQYQTMDVNEYLEKGENELISTWERVGIRENLVHQ